MKQPYETNLLTRLPYRLVWARPYCDKRFQTKGIARRHIRRKHEN